MPEALYTTASGATLAEGAEASVQLTAAAAHVALDVDSSIFATAAAAQVAYRYREKVKTTGAAVQVAIVEQHPLVYYTLSIIATPLDGGDPVYLDAWLRSRSFRISWSEGRQADTLNFEVEIADGSIDVSSLIRARITVDVLEDVTGVTQRLFSGDVLRVLPTGIPSLDYPIYAIYCEATKARLDHVPAVRKTYISQTVKAIFLDLLQADSLISLFDTSRMETGPVLDVFSVSEGTISKAADKLITACSGVAEETWTWWIDPREAIRLHPQRVLEAPYAIGDITNATWYSVFPHLKGQFSLGQDTSELVTTVIVYGGAIPSAIAIETFTGDGTTVIFALAHQEIWEVLSVKIDGVWQTFGYDWYDSFDDYDCLIDYVSGTVRWPVDSAPGIGAVIEVRYTYADQIVVTRTLADVGLTNPLPYEIYREVSDGSITTESAAVDLADGILRELGQIVETGSFGINRLGCEPGQTLRIQIPRMSVNLSVVVRSVQIQSGQVGELLLTVAFGGKKVKLSSRVSSASGSVSRAYSSGAGLAAATIGDLPRELEDLRDVSLSLPASAELLTYDDSAGEWINRTAAEAGLAAADHDHVEADITDLDHDAVKLQGRTVASTAPADGEALIWDGTSSAWAPGEVATAGLSTDPLWNAAGDLVQGTGDDTAARLAIGTAGQVLTVNSAATAAEWATPTSGGGSATGSGGHISRSTSQSIAASTNVALEFTSEDQDDANYADLSTYPTRLTIPSTGWYLLVAWADTDSSSRTRYLNLRVNGTSWRTSTSDSMGDARMQVTLLAYLTAGDYVEAVLWNSTAGSVEFASFAIHSLFGSSSSAAEFLTTAFTSVPAVTLDPSLSISSVAV